MDNPRPGGNRDGGQQPKGYRASHPLGVHTVARSAHPWFWESRNCWAVILGGQRHVLGDHPAAAPPPRKKKNKWIVPQTIQNLFDTLKVSLRGGPPPAAEPARLSVAEVFEKFLDWCQKNRSPRTYEWSRNHIQSFINSLKARKTVPAGFPAEELRPFHLTDWVDANRTPKPGKRAWGANHRRGAITAVQRAFTWAEKQGHITKSPIRHVEKPAPKRREQMLTPGEFAALLAAVKDDAFRNVLEFCWETGCRVQEVRVLEAEHYKADRPRFELPPGLAKGKKRWRLIYLTTRATEIVAPLVGRHAEGPVFRNVDGHPWDAQNFNCRFVRLHAKLGVKYTLTSIRHSFCQRLLEAGVDHTTVAALMGHTDAVMVSRIYSHMDQAKDFLRDELLRASGAGKAA